MVASWCLKLEAGASEAASSEAAAAALAKLMLQAEVVGEVSLQNGFFRFWGGIFGGIYFQDPSCLVLLLLVHAWQQKMRRGQSREKRASSLQTLHHHRP